jgi:hypothetical protein
MKKLIAIILTLAVVLSFAIAANTDDKKATINDALEILMYLAGMDSKAAPGSTIDDALDILIYLAGIGELPEKFTEITQSTNSGFIAPIMIRKDSGNVDFRAEIISELSISRTEEYLATHTMNNISKIREFYIPQKIDEFELFNVMIGAISFAYSFAAKNLDAGRNGDYVICYDTGIEIVIQRPETITDFADAADYLREIAQANNFLYTNDGFVFTDRNIALNSIWGQIGDTIFVIRAPKSFDYNRLRSLALDLISTAELVNVDEEIGRLAQ